MIDKWLLIFILFFHSWHALDRLLVSISKLGLSPWIFYSSYLQSNAVQRVYKGFTMICQMDIFFKIIMISIVIVLILLVIVIGLLVWEWWERRKKLDKKRK